MLAVVHVGEYSAFGDGSEHKRHLNESPQRHGFSTELLPSSNSCQCSAYYSPIYPLKQLLLMLLLCIESPEALLGVADFADTGCFLIAQVAEAGLEYSINIILSYLPVTSGFN